MKPVATVSSQSGIYQVVLSEEYMSNLEHYGKTLNLYALPKELPHDLVDALNEAIMASTCAEQVWERFLPHLTVIKEIKP